MPSNPFAAGPLHPAFGLKAEVGALVKRSIRLLLIHVLDDRILHAEILAAGRPTFRAAFVKDMGAAFGKDRAPCDELANHLYRFLEVAWRDRYRDMGPEVFLNSVAPISPPTEDEIENAWELDIASSEDALRMQYEGSARHRKGRDLGLKHKLERPS